MVGGGRWWWLEVKRVQPTNNKALKIHVLVMLVLISWFENKRNIATLLSVEPDLGYIKQM